MTDHIDSIIEVFNKENNTNIKKQDYLISNPFHIQSNIHNKNTHLILKPYLHSKKYGFINIYYNRIDLSLIPAITIARANAVDYNSLLPVISEETGFDIKLVDIVNEQLDNLMINTLQASVNSYMFFNSLVVHLT